MCPKISTRYKPSIINATYLDDEYDGEATFTVLGGESYVTEEDKKTVECILLREPNGETILYSPNATARKLFSAKKLIDTDLMRNHRLVLYTTDVQFGSKTVRGVRIKEICEPRPEQEKIQE